MLGKWLGFFCGFLNHYAPVSQANWYNVTLQLIISSLLIHALVWPQSSPHQDSNPGPRHERQMTYQLSYPSLLTVNLRYLMKWRNLIGPFMPWDHPINSILDGKSVYWIAKVYIGWWHSNQSKWILPHMYEQKFVSCDWIGWL